MTDVEFRIKRLGQWEEVNGRFIRGQVLETRDNNASLELLDLEGLSLSIIYEQSEVNSPVRGVLRIDDGDEFPLPWRDSVEQPCQRYEHRDYLVPGQYCIFTLNLEEGKHKVDLVLDENLCIVCNIGFRFDAFEVKPNKHGWPSDPTVNVPIVTAEDIQALPKLVSDGEGGAIFVWLDLRSGVPFQDIYAQRVNDKAAMLWTTNGVLISTAENITCCSAQLVSDGAGGAIIAWGGSGDIYAQRINANGIVDWDIDAVPISTAAGEQRNIQLVSDGKGGAIITWEDNRSRPDTTAFSDIYAQRVDGDGKVLWSADGVPISTAGFAAHGPQLISDGGGGVLITWSDHRVFRNPDIYAQRVDGDGNVLWSPDGVPIEL